MTDHTGGEPDDAGSARRRDRHRAEHAAPSFDDAVVPPRPPLPGRDAGTGVRDEWRQTRDELERQVQHAREQFDQANEKIKQRTGRDLIKAILIGAAIGAVVLGSLLFIKWLFVPFAVAAALLGVYELSLALRAAGRRIDVVPQLVLGALVVLAGCFAEAWISWVMLFAAVAVLIVWRLIAQMIAKDGRMYGDVLADAIIGGFVQVYVPFLTSLAIVVLAQENGQWWVLGFIAIAVAADTAAYASGLSFGRHPMAPRISPKKTWEGFAGAVVGAVGVGILFGVFLLGIPVWAGAVFGAAVLISATLGDLGESMIKRELGIKDMSSWLPGHGGLLDRLDSILPSTVPALLLYFMLSPWAA